MSTQDEATAAPQWSDEKGAPYVFAQQSQREGLVEALLRAFISITLLAVLLLSFGAAIGGWFLLENQKRALLEAVHETPPSAELIVAYRNELERISNEMSASQTVLSVPDKAGLYSTIMAERDKLGACRGDADIGGPVRCPSWDAGYDWQAIIDSYRQDNESLRWLNEQLRYRGPVRRNPREAPIP